MNSYKAVRVWAHRLCPKNSSIGKMFRSMSLCTDLVEVLCKNFNGTAIYTGDGSENCQISDLVAFKEIDEDDFQFIPETFKEFVTNVTGLYDQYINSKLNL